MSDLVAADSYEQIQDSLRPWLAQRLKGMYEALEPFVNGSYGEVIPGHAAAAVAVLRELGRLYRVQDPPAPQLVGVSEAEVQVRILEAVAAARIEWEQQRLELEAGTRERVMAQIRA